MKTGKLQYGEKVIEYQLLTVKRKSLEIAVHPDLSVIIKMPESANFEAVETMIRKRSRWIIKQQQYFAQFLPKTPKKSYINGETHLYLGRQYRVRIDQGLSDSVKLQRGRFMVVSKELTTPEKVEKLLNQWYRKKALHHFQTILEECWQKFQIKRKPVLKVRKMDKRWGSLTPDGTMTLNQNLIKTPRECIEYVIIHELCHVNHPSHNKEFQKLLSQKLPAWQKLKHRLELSLI